MMKPKQVRQKALRCTNKQELKAAVGKAWQKISREKTHLVMFMDLIQAVIDLFFETLTYQDRCPYDCACKLVLPSVGVNVFLAYCTHSPR